MISESFGIEVKSDDILIDISPRTSRKSDFIPPVVSKRKRYEQRNIDEK